MTSQSSKDVLNVKLDEGATLPTRAHETDAGLDLYASDWVLLQPQEHSLVPTGISVEIPVGHVGLVFIRSGFSIKTGATLTNSVGVIDAEYRGELKVPLMNHSPHDTLTVRQGARIAQMLIVPIATPKVVEVQELGQTGRGTGGFGSTGVS